MLIAPLPLADFGLAPVRTVKPAKPPISLEDAKAHLRVDVDDDDKVVTLLIETATSWLDGRSGIVGRAMITQTWQQSFRGFQDWRAVWAATAHGMGLRFYDDRLALPLGPVQSVSSIAYYDIENIQRTLDPATYHLFTDALGPYVAPVSTNQWPSTYSRRDAVTVTFIAGYGDNPEDVPAPLRHALLLMLGHLYENREQVVVGNVSAIDLPLGITALLEPLRATAF